MAEIINAANFEEKVLKNSKPVLVDFFATWCGPCKMMSPVMDESAAEKAGVVDDFKIDGDETQSVAQKYQVMSIPTLIVFEHGQVKKQTLGAQPKAAVLDLLA